MMNLTAIPASFLIPVALRSTGRRSPFLLGLSCFFITGSVILVAAPGIAYLGALLAGIAQGGLFALVMTLPLDFERTPARVGALVAMMLGLGYTIAATSPFILGAIRDVTGSFDAVLWVAAAFLMAQFFALLALTRRHPSAAAPSDATRSRQSCARATIRVRYGNDVEPVDAGKTVGVARVEGDLVRDGHRRDHRVEGASCRLASLSSQRGCNLAKRASLGRSEWERVEVCLGLLKVRLPAGLFVRCARHERPDGELGEGDSRDQRLVWQQRGIVEAGEEDHRARVEQAVCGRHQSELSTTASMSARSVSASTTGRRDQRSSSVAARAGRRRTGASSATGSPARVTVRCSPAITRSMTSPPWFRSSRIVTARIGTVYHM